jgi:hypothetical protein
MLLSELIKEAEGLLATNGDLDVFLKNIHQLEGLSVRVSDGGFPPSWCMPKDYKYVVARDRS